MGDGKSFQIIDGKHGKALVAGNNFDGHVYHQDPGERSNAIWRLTPKVGDGEAPQEFVLSENYLTTIYHFDQKQIIGDPKRIIVMDKARNTGSRDFKETLDKKREITVIESWSTSNSVSHKIMASITASYEVGVEGVEKAKIETTVGTEEETTNSKTNSGSREVKYAVSFTTEVTVAPNESIACCRVIEYSTANIPFTAKIKRTYGDHRTVVVDESGMFKGTDFSTSNIHCGPESEHLCDDAPLQNTSGEH